MRITAMRFDQAHGANAPRSRQRQETISYAMFRLGAYRPAPVRCPAVSSPGRLLTSFPRDRDTHESKAQEDRRGRFRHYERRLKQASDRTVGGTGSIPA